VTDEPTAASVLAEQTLDEKASLCLGSDFWHTAPVPRGGIPAITLSDEPQQRRLPRRSGQFNDRDHPGEPRIRTVRPSGLIPVRGERSVRD
jgi:hypothetical protein